MKIKEHWKMGIEYNYPKCCIMKFIIFQIILKTSYWLPTFPYKIHWKTNVPSIERRRCCPYHFMYFFLKKKLGIFKFIEYLPEPPYNSSFGGKYNYDCFTGASYEDTKIW